MRSNEFEPNYWQDSDKNRFEIICKINSKWLYSCVFRIFKKVKSKNSGNHFMEVSKLIENAPANNDKFDNNRNR